MEQIMKFLDKIRILKFRYFNKLYWSMLHRFHPNHKYNILKLDYLQDIMI